MKYSVILVLFMLFAVSGCNKTELKPDSDLIIKAGFACGWGAGEDSLEISKTAIKYFFYIPSQSMEPVVSRSRPVTDSEWEEILNAVSLDTFARLNYNTCNICVDGCDEWIELQDKNYSHKIRFTKEEKIEQIVELQDLIAKLRAEFKE